MTKKSSAASLGIDPDLMEEILGEKVAPTKRKHPRAKHYIGAPLAFLREVCLLTRGRSTAMVALCIYRRVCVNGNRTVTLPSADLRPLDVGRSRKREALAQLQSAGLIKVRNARGRSARVTLLWRPS